MNKNIELFPKETLTGKRIVLKRIFPDIDTARKIYSVENASRNEFLP